jgi:choice-of-anchor B domain-containing protein
VLRSNSIRRWRCSVAAAFVAAAFVAACFVAGPAAAQAAPAASISKNVTLLAHFDNYTRYSACWSYVHHDGREYAVLGTETGTSIVNITNPSAAYEVAFIPGLTSIWREMKQYRTWIYISTEAIGGGIQIVRMTDPENPVLVSTYTGAFNRAHTVSVDTTRALLVCNGTRLTNGHTGMRILSLASPESPVELGYYTFDYVHDSWMRGTTLYASSIGTGTIRVFDIMDPSFPDELVAWSYPGAKTHSGETSKDGRYLYICDEINYSTLKIFDLQDLFAHPLIYETTVNPLAIVHNVHVKQDTAFVAWYTEGVRLFDITDPTLPAEWAYYDTYPGFSGGFHGVWEVAPLFPSGTFIASDIETGLYVFRANPDYGVVKARVTSPGGAPLAGADVVRFGSSDSSRTAAAGVVRLAIPPGERILTVKKFGYKQESVVVNVAKGGQLTVDVTLTPLPSTTVTGIVRRAADQAPLDGADVEAEATPLRATSAAGGSYGIAGVPVGIYRFTSYRPGYAPDARWYPVEPGVQRSLNWSLLSAAWYDSCDTDRGWSLTDPSDNATFAGRWARAVPNGTSGLAPRLPRGVHLAAQHPEPEEGAVVAGPVAPGTDATPGAGGWCFVTGNGPPGAGVGDYDVDVGKTTLTTPPLDMTGMVDPVMTFQRWFHMNSPGEPDSFLVEISPDGTTWTRVLTLLESHPHWHLETIRVRDHATPGPAIRVRFVAQDQGPEGIVEAAVDDFQHFDAALHPTEVDAARDESAPRAALGAPRPNPSAGAVSVALFLPAAGPARAAVYDVAGRRVAPLFDGPAPAGRLLIRWDGRNARGDDAASGLYWIRAEAAGGTFTRRLVRLR